MQLDLPAPKLTVAACVRSFQSPDFSEHRAVTTRSPHRGTGTWIFAHPLYKAWNASSHGILWIKGHPGTGKSILIGHICRSVHSTRNFRMMVLDCFFLGRGAQMQKSPEGMFRSLLLQLRYQSAVAREMIYGAFLEKQKTSAEGWQWQFRELERLLRDLVREVGKRAEIVLFVDALDEAVDDKGEKAASELLQLFQELSDSVIEDVGCLGGFKVCIACRPYPVLAPGASVIVVEEHNLADMEEYVRDMLITGVQDWAEEPQGARQGLIDAIVSKSRGVFLWTSLRVPKINRLLNDGAVAFEEISEFVADESTELLDFYKAIFVNDIEVHLRKRSLLFMQWIALAQRPLTLTELRYALACDDEECTVFPICCEEVTTFISSDARMEKLTKSLSGGLAEVRHYTNASIVQFIHESVNEYVRNYGIHLLVSMTSAKIDHSPSDLIAKGEDRLSRSCINYFNMKNVSTEALQWHHYGEKWLQYGADKPPFIEYSSKFWFRHAERAENGGISQESLSDRFDPTSEAFEAYVSVSGTLNNNDSRCPRRGGTLIHIGSGSNLQSVVKRVAHTNGGVDQIDSRGDTALHWAVREGHEQMVDLLLNLGANPNGMPTRHPKPGPLELAVANDHGKVVKLLLDRGANANEMDVSKGGPLQAAAKKGNLHLVRMLIKYGADVKGCSGGENSPLLQTGGNEEIARLLIREGADANTQGGYFGNPLQSAILSGSQPLIRVLLNNGADIHAQGGLLGNALQAACTYQTKTKMARLLLDMGADINAVGGDFGTALQAACESNAEDVVRMLLAERANPNLQGGLLGTPLIAAAKEGNQIIVELLIENGADIQIQGGEYGNALQAAVVSGSRDLVEMFLARGLDVNIAGGIYGTALQAAVVHSPALFELLLSRGADIWMPGPEYCNPLNAAIFHNREHHVRVLLERGAGSDINTKLPESSYARTEAYPYMLQMAALRGNPKVVGMLLDHGAEIDTVEGIWGSAITIAAAEGHLAVFELLLERGADVYLKGGFNGSTFKAARKHKAISRILEQREAENRAKSKKIVYRYGL